MSSAHVIERQAPTWLDVNDVLGSAVKHITALSPTFNWVGIYILNGDMLELGPYIGAPTEHTRNAFDSSLEAAVKQIAQDLGDFWPSRKPGGNEHDDETTADHDRDRGYDSGSHCNVANERRSTRSPHSKSRTPTPSGRSC